MQSAEVYIQQIQEGKIPLEKIIKYIQNEALFSCKIVTLQTYKKNDNGQWRAACLSIIKSIKTLEGEEDELEENDQDAN